MSEEIPVGRYLRRVPWWAWLLTVGGIGLTVYLLGPVLTPFAVSFILAYLFQPLVRRLERWHLPRTLAVIVVFMILIVLLLVAALVLLPPLQAQTRELMALAPRLGDWLQNRALPWLSSTLGVERQRFEPSSLRDLLREHLSQAGSLAGAVLQRVSQSGLALIGFFANLFLVPVVTFYLLRDWNKMITAIEGLIPRPLLPTVQQLMAEADEVLGAFLRGQLSVMLVLGTYYGVGLWLIGLDFAVAIGVFAGLVSFIPYLGVFLGAGTALLVAMFSGADWLTYALVVAVFWTGQILEGSVVTPTLVGDRIGLHPVMVIFAVLAGGQIFGIVGVLLALPAAAVIAVFARHLRKLYRSSELYDIDDAGDRDAAPR